MDWLNKPDALYGQKTGYTDEKVLHCHPKAVRGVAHSDCKAQTHNIYSTVYASVITYNHMTCCVGSSEKTYMCTIGDISGQRLGTCAL